MAVTVEQLIERREGTRRDYPVVASKKLLAGTLAFVTTGGYATDVTGSGANRFIGIVRETVDNTGGSSGDKQVEVYRKGEFKLVGTSFTQASVGLDLLASDNYTTTTTPTASTVRIGEVTKFVSTTVVWCDIDVPDGPSNIDAAQGASPEAIGGKLTTHTLPVNIDGTVYHVVLSDGST